MHIQTIGKQYHSVSHTLMHVPTFMNTAFAYIYTHTHPHQLQEHAVSHTLYFHEHNICVNMYTHRLQEHTIMLFHTSLCMCILSWVHTFTCTCTHTYTVCTKYRHTIMLINTPLCMHVSPQAYTHTHTHTHTLTQTQTDSHIYYTRYHMW